MSTSLQIWQKKLQAEGEDIYFSGELGQGLPFLRHMVFISDRRLIFIKKNFFQIEMLSIFLSQIGALRLDKQTRQALIIIGLALCVVGIGVAVIPNKINTILSLPDFLSQLHGLIVFGIGCFFILLSKIWPRARVFIDVYGLSSPLKLPWSWGDAAFVSLTKNITYYSAVGDDKL